MSNVTDALPATPEDVSIEDGDLPDPYRFEYGNTKLDPDHFDVVPRAFSAGADRRMAASMAQVTAETLRIWMCKGEHNIESDAPLNRYGAFRLHVERGIVSYQAAELSKIDDPQWKLERIYPDQFGKKDRTVIEEKETPRPPTQAEKESKRKEDEEFVNRMVDQ
jgi:hypothetical protein